MAKQASKATKTQHPHIDALIEHFGGPTQLASDLKKHKLHPVTERAIELWCSRGSIPMRRLIDLQKLGKVLKKPVNIGVYIEQLAA